MNLQLALGVVAIALIPFVPSLLRLRIRLFRRLHWQRLADITERHFALLVPGIRIALVIVAAALFWIGR